MNVPFNKSGEHKIDRASLDAHSPKDIATKRRTAESNRTLRGEVATFGIDSCGFVTSWPRSAEQVFGFDPTDVTGKHIAIIYCDADLKHGRAAYELVAAASRGYYATDGWQRRSNGQVFWAHTEHKKTESGFEISILEVAASEKFRD